MTNQKSVLLLFFLLTIACLKGQEQANEPKKYYLSTLINTVGVTDIRFTDPYLSPLSYSGIGVDVQLLSRRYFSASQQKFSQQNSFNLLWAAANNPAKTSMAMYIRSTVGYGIHYHYRPMSNLQLMVGGVWDLDLGAKTLMRNVNNPANMELASQLNFSEIIQYAIPLKKRTLKVELGFQSPALGFMFVPLQNASYYEMFQLGNTSDAFHFSSIHNRQGLTTNFALQVPFQRSVWRFGFKYRYLKYKANQQVYVNDEFSFCFGGSMDVIRFSGTKNKAPENFISTND